MEQMKVTRRRRRSPKWLKYAVLAALIALVAASLLFWRALEKPQRIVKPLPAQAQDGLIVAHNFWDIAHVEVTLRSGEHWSVTMQEDGTLRSDAEGFTLSDYHAGNLEMALAAVGYTRVLAETADEYAGSLADFGLDTPKAIVTCTYSDETSVTLRIGNSSGGYEDESYYYMTVDGDERLLALDLGTAQVFMVEERELRPVTQPVIHKARIDRIRIERGESVDEWALAGQITDGDAQDRWFLVLPVRYPAEGERVTSLRENLANIRLGAYVCEATPEALTAYGFDAPRMILTVHQAAGDLGAVGTAGDYVVVSYPEQEDVFVVGGAQNDMVDYVRYGDAIYLTGHFTLSVFLDAEAARTVTRYPVLTALGNLETLTIEQGGVTTEYRITRTERVAPNNDLVLDENGEVVYDVACTRNGEAFSYSVFEGRYNDLLITTVSGTLPDGWTPAEAPHTTYTFVERTGTTHTIALARFDALHDAVLVDDCALFYIVSGGFAFEKK